MNLLTDNLALLYDTADDSTVTSPDLTITSVQDGANPSNQFIPVPVITASGPFNPGNFNGLTSGFHSAADQQALKCTTTLSLPPSTPSSIYAVYKPRAVPTPFTVVGGPNYGPIEAGFGGNTVLEVGDGTGYLDYSFTAVPGHEYVFAITSDGTVAGTKLFVDGVLQTPIGTSGTVVDMSIAFIGCRTIGAGSFCDGLLPHVRAYTTQHSDSDALALTQYLQRKFGI